MLHQVFCTFDDSTPELDSVIVLSRSLGSFSLLWPGLFIPPKFLKFQFIFFLLSYSFTLFIPPKFLKFQFIFGLSYSITNQFGNLSHMYSHDLP